MKKRNKKNIIFFTLIFTLFLFFEYIYVLIGIDYNNLSLNTKVYLLLFKNIVFTIIFIVRYHEYLKDKFIDFKEHYKSYLAFSFKWWITGIIAMYFINMLIYFITKTLPTNEDSVNLIFKTNIFIALISTVVFAPFVEEMIFRKSLSDCFSNKILFMITSGLVFGSMHVLVFNSYYELLYILSYGLFGVFFAHILNKKNNIYCTMAIHAFHNLLASILLLLVR